MCMINVLSHDRQKSQINIENLNNNKLLLEFYIQFNIKTYLVTLKRYRK